MGEYIVNGEVVDVRASNPTAADLKQANQSLDSDWVMASMPDGSIQRVDDGNTLPAAATDFAVVTPYEYGSLVGHKW